MAGTSSAETTAFAAACSSAVLIVASTPPIAVQVALAALKVIVSLTKVYVGTGLVGVTFSQRTGCCCEHG